MAGGGISVGELHKMDAVGFVLSIPRTRALHLMNLCVHCCWMLRKLDRLPQMLALAELVALQLVIGSAQPRPAEWS